jgi:hypothetical protein
MPIGPVKFRPGIVRETTQYANSGGWFDADKVRFRDGYAESIGGWQSLTTNTLTGVCRSMNEWTSLQGYGFVGFGTNSKFYVLSSEAYYDITPKRDPQNLPNNPFSTAADPNTLVVNMPYGGAIEGDFITFSGATTGVGNYSVDDLNSEFQVQAITDLTTLILKGKKNAGAANLVGGGPSVVANPDINSGPVDASYAVGYGIGGYGIGPYGNARNPASDRLSPVIIQPRLWSQDNFGQDLVINPRGGGIYYWAATKGVASRAVPLSTLPGAADVPMLANEIFVSIVDENVVALGCSPLGEQDLDPMQVRWSDQENPAMWTPARSNNAGGQRLASGSQIIGHLQTTQDTLVWTDKTLYAMTYGGQFTYGFNPIANEIGQLGPKTAVQFGSSVAWMEHGAFYAYSGYIQELPCSVKDYVFGDFNYLQAWKSYGILQRAFPEIWWFYCSAESTEIDSYVIWNYKDNNWSIGKLSRTAWLYSDRLQTPMAVDASGSLWQHETGTDAGTDPLSSYIESADIDDGSGENFLFLSRIIPDVQFTGTSDYQRMQVEVLKRDSSMVPKILERTLDINPGKKYLDTRARSRRLSVRFKADTVGTGWRLGNTEVKISAAGKR